MADKVGYNFRENVSQGMMQKALMSFDFEKVDVLSIDETGEEYDPEPPTGSAAVVLSSPLPIHSRSLPFDAGAGLALTAQHGFFTVTVGGQTEKIKFLANTGVAGAGTGILTIERRAVNGVGPLLIPNDAVVTFLHDGILFRREWVVAVETEGGRLWINPSTYEPGDTDLSYPVDFGYPMTSKKSTANSVFMSSESGTISVRIINRW